MTVEAPSPGHDGRRRDPRPLSISVVIAAYTEERWNDLFKAVDSSRAQTAAPLETLVVIDHNSTLFARASRHYASLPDVRVVESAGERGLAGARNTGVA